MNVLSVASEVYPLIKTGGLADVVGALPSALAPHGIDVTTLLPAYPAVAAKVTVGDVIHEWPQPGSRLLRAEHDGLKLLLLDNPRLFNRAGGPYTDKTGKDWPDNWARFAALGRAAADIAAGRIPGLSFDIVHAHDWQAAMAPVYMRYDGTATPSVITVHNLAFQGRFGGDIFASLSLPPHAFGLDGVEFWGDVSFLKGALASATAITTVSPTYADEIRTPEFGWGLDGLLRARGDAVSGIVNGIDQVVWDPGADRALPVSYTPVSLNARIANKTAIEHRFGLALDRGLLFCVVSRLTPQKGIDVLAEVADDLVAMGARLAVLGAGDPDLEQAVKDAAHRHPGRIGVVIGYDEGLSHLLQGGSDAILIPSRFEPCGLTQLYGLRYGCVPVVARTGGLADTVIDANEAALNACVATGFQFDSVTPDVLRRTLRRAVDLYANRKEWQRLQKNGMKGDYSWSRSGARYCALYKRILRD